MSEEAKKEATEHINLKVLGQDGQVVHFKIKQHTSLKKLMSAYCARSKLAQATVRFRFDGQPISENDTPRGLDMEDGDTIEVFQQQTGGHYSDTTEQEQFNKGQNTISAHNSGLNCPQYNTATRGHMASPLIHTSKISFQSTVTALYSNKFSADIRSFYSDLTDISFSILDCSCSVMDETLLPSCVNSPSCDKLPIFS